MTDGLAIFLALVSLVLWWFLTVQEYMLRSVYSKVPAVLPSCLWCL